MDPLRLLSRSTKLSRSNATGFAGILPSGGQNASPQVLSSQNQAESHSLDGSRKRKRSTLADEHGDIEFFGRSDAQDFSDPGQRGRQAQQEPDRKQEVVSLARESVRDLQRIQESSIEHAKKVLKEHKVKVTWLNPVSEKLNSHRKSKAKVERAVKQEKLPLFPQPLSSFQTLQSQHDVNRKLVSNIRDQGYVVPTEVQLSALPLLLDHSLSYMPEEMEIRLPADRCDGVDLLTVAPTGSGKTIAFLIPLLHRIKGFKREQEASNRSTAAVVLAPTKELAEQIVNEGRKIAKGTGIRISQVRKGMRLAAEGQESVHDDDVSMDMSAQESHTVVKSDILVATPGTLAGIISSMNERDQHPLSTVRHLVLDEADVLLDPLFRDQTLSIWNSLTCPELRISLWSATMGSNIEELARAHIDERRQRLSDASGKPHAAAPLIRLVIGLKDSAVPNVQHKLIYAASEQGKLLSLRQLLHPTATPADSASASAAPPLVPPFLVFTQTIERAAALHAELQYDIPAEAGGGAARLAVLHAGLSDAARARVMARFRAAELWVLITTDLLARGVDFRGVNAVVNYDLPTSSAAYVHRAGRTGRAGRAGGVAVTLYTREDVPFLKNVANVIALAQKEKAKQQQGLSSSSSSPGAAAVPQDQSTELPPWLLDALPSLSKKARQQLKRRGVAARSARAREADPKAARRARISTKAGFVRREENRRKGAIAGARRRQAQSQEDQAVGAEGADGSDFDGFD